MRHIFPLVTETSKIRGIVGIIKGSGGTIELSKLAEEANEQIDDLLPLVEACKLLGIATVDESEIKLTPLGNSLNINNTLKVIKEKLIEMEPFFSAVEILNMEGNLSTEDLLQKLNERGIYLHGEKEQNEFLMKKMLLRLGVRAKLVYYAPDRDLWSAKPFSKGR